MLVDADEEAMNTPKALTVYSRIAQVKLNTLVVKYSWLDLRRFFEPGDHSDDEQHGTIMKEGYYSDPLAEMLYEGLRTLPKNDPESDQPDIDLNASLSVLLEPDLKPFKPNAWIAFDIRSKTRVVGCLTSCNFVADVSFQTHKLTPSYCKRSKLPTFDEDWLLLDVISSAKQGSGTLLVLAAYLHAARMKKQGLVTIAVTEGGKTLFQALGFESHRDEVYYIPLSALTLAAVHAKLRTENAILSTCFRHGLSPSTAANVIGRC